MRRRDAIVKLAEIDLEVKALARDVLQSGTLSANLTAAVVMFAKDADAVLRVAATGEEKYGTLEDGRTSLRA